MWRVGVDQSTLVVVNLQPVVEHLQVPFQPQSKMAVVRSERQMYVVVPDQRPFAAKMSIVYCFGVVA